MFERRSVNQIAAFLVCFMLGLLIAVIGLRQYYNNARLYSKLFKVYHGNSLQVLGGQVKVENMNLLVSSIKPGGFSFINAGFLHIDPQFYERLEVEFDDIHPQQPLILNVRFEPEGSYATEAPISVEHRVRVNGNKVSLSLHDLKPENKIIIDVGVISDKLLKPYRIKMIKAVPKTFNHFDFIHLLWDCFAINKNWENWSINTHKSPHWVLIPPKILVLIIFCVHGILFGLYLWLTGRRVINAWWAAIAAAWLTLDAHYLVEKTVIAKNTYDTFADLTDDEKDLVLSPEPAKLAQTIKSVMPNDGKLKKIRIQLGWKNKWPLKASDSSKRYFFGKLHYYLSPNTIYLEGRKMSKENWQQGGFYFVDVNDQGGISFNGKQNHIVTPFQQRLFAERIVAEDNVIIYYVFDEEYNTRGNSK